jgi:hypothetical protein
VDDSSLNNKELHNGAMKFTDLSPVIPPCRQEAKFIHKPVWEKIPATAQN